MAPRLTELIPDDDSGFQDNLLNSLDLSLEGEGSGDDTVSFQEETREGEESSTCSSKLVLHEEENSDSRTPTISNHGYQRDKQEETDHDRMHGHEELSPRLPLFTMKNACIFVVALSLLSQYVWIQAFRFRSQLASEPGMFERPEVTGKYRKDHTNIVEAIHELQDALQPPIRKTPSNGDEGNVPRFERIYTTGKWRKDQGKIVKAIRELQVEVQSLKSSIDGEEMRTSREYPTGNSHSAATSILSKPEDVLTAPASTDPQEFPSTLLELQKLYSSMLKQVTEMIEENQVRESSNFSGENASCSSATADEKLAQDDISSESPSMKNTIVKDGKKQDEDIIEGESFAQAKENPHEGDLKASSAQPTKTHEDTISLIFDLVSEDRDVVLNGLKTLINRMEESNRKERRRMIRTIVRQSSGLPFLLACSSKWKDDILISSHGLSFLNQLLILGDESVAQTLSLDTNAVDTNAVKVVTSIMGIHQAKSIQRLGLGALYRMVGTSDKSAFQSVAFTTDIVNAVVTAMKVTKINAEDERIQEMGCVTLNYLSYRDVSPDVELIKVVINALKMYPENPELRRSACKTLYKVTRWDSLRRPLIRLNGIQILEQIKMLSNDDETQKWIGIVLRRLRQ